ncbi:TAXI family TRAP transporter solute-binding subunit [Microbispora hainanensis]|uniref:TAXI family TRAP transporter solute-binding subunit n=1 Tax=Microbispora hainanensis TaxID=568844 RepID=A0ABZ1SYA8_9ACTN
MHASAKEITLADAPKTDPVPLHEGARKFYG